MMMRRIVLAILAGLAAAIPVAADEQGPTALVCTFDKGQSWTFEGGTYTSQAPSKLVFEIRAIDLDKQAADLAIDDKPAGKLRVVRALNANSFLEVANEGFLNLTTVYDRDATAGIYPAVHSRHFGILGQPVFAQYAGACSGK